MLSDICFLSKRRLSGPLFKAEILEIKAWIFDGFVCGPLEDTAGSSSLVAELELSLCILILHYDVLDGKDAEQVGDNLIFLYFKLQ